MTVRYLKFKGPGYAFTVRHTGLNSGVVVPGEVCRLLFHAPIYASNPTSMDWGIAFIFPVSFYDGEDIARSLPLIGLPW